MLLYHPTSNSSFYPQEWPLIFLETQPSEKKNVKLKISNHNLGIDTDYRYCKLKLNRIERVCKYCSDTSIEDENNIFSFSCHFYKDQITVTLM